MFLPHARGAHDLYLNEVLGLHRLKRWDKADHISPQDC